MSAVAGVTAIRRTRGFRAGIAAVATLLTRLPQQRMPRQAGAFSIRTKKIHKFRHDRLLAHESSTAQLALETSALDDFVVGRSQTVLLGHNRQKLPQVLDSSASRARFMCE